MLVIRQYVLLLCSLLLVNVGMLNAQTISIESAIDKARFVENKGQWDSQVLYQLRFTHGKLFLEENTFTYSFVDAGILEGFIGNHHAGIPGQLNPNGPSIIPSHAFKIHFDGALSTVKLEGAERFSHYENYFLGNDPSKWAGNVANFGRVFYRNLYAGIDMTIYGGADSLKYDFILEPGANPSQIQMTFEGVDNIYLKDGKLHYETSVTHIVEQHPVAYQVIGNEKVFIACEFQLNGNTAGFSFPNGFNTNYPLVIDPTIIFASYTGSLTDNWGYTATYDNTGHLYAGGIVFRGLGYPTTTGAFQTTFGGGTGFYNGGISYAIDIGITKFSPDGSSLIYSTYLGGAGNETPHSIVVNNQNELIVYGATSSNNFPTPNAYDNTFNGGNFVNVNDVLDFTTGSDIFVTKFNAAGTGLVGSTYVGGTDNDGLNLDATINFNYSDHARGEVVVDNNGFIYVTSSTYSSDFPTTPGVAQPIYRGAQEAVVIKLSPNLNTLVWCSFYGGSSGDSGYSIKVDNASNVFVAGGTRSIDLSNTSNGINPAYGGGIADGYIAKFNSTGSTILNATYIGTNAYDQVYLLELDYNKDVFVFGQTLGNYPVTPATVYNNNNGTQFIHKLSNNLTSTEFSTRFGSGTLNKVNLSPSALRVDVCDNIFLSGWGGRVNVNHNTANLNIGTTTGLPVTPDASKPTTDGSDFYFMILSKDADSLVFATFFGGNSTTTPGRGEEHCDGGTSRFDDQGIIYQAVCAGCGAGNIFPTTPGAWSETNGTIGQPNANCNLGVVKYGFDLKKINVAVTAFPNTEGCVPLSLVLNPNSPNIDNWFWDLGNGQTSTIEYPVVTYNDTGTFIVQLIGFDSTTCSGLKLTDTSFLTIIVRDDSLSANFFPTLIDSCGPYNVNFTNTSTNINGGQLTYLWNFGDSQTSTLANPSHSYATNGAYTVTLIVNSPNSCNPLDTATVDLLFTPDIDAGIGVLDTLGCTPFTVDFNNLSTPLSGTQTYTWEFDDGSANGTSQNPIHTFSQTGIYSVMLTVVDSSTCNIVDSATINITVNNDSVLADFTSAILIDNCDSLLVDFTDQSTNATSWIWDFGDGTTSTDLNPTHNYSTADTFDVMLIATNGNTCNNVDTARAQFIKIPEVVALFDPENGCVPLDLVINNQSQNATTYAWRFHDLSTSSLQSPTLNYTTAGTYTILLTASNPNTCNLTDSYTTEVVVYALPTAFFTTDTGTYVMFETIQFNNESTSPGTYNWQFGDGASSSLTNPTYRYENEGTYNPCVEVTDTNSCMAQYCKSLEILFAGAIDVPNAFSPNGDNLNDILFLEGFGVTELEFRIYNRWGELVFESDRLDHGWDGRYKGTDQEMEVYTYTLRASFENGVKTGLRKGNITLVR